MIDNNLNANNPNVSQTQTSQPSASPPSPYEEAYIKWKHDNSIKHLPYEEQLDKAIDTIDSIKSLNDMTEDEFTDKVKPYVDKINNRKFKQYHNNNLKHIAEDELFLLGRQFIGDIIAPSLITALNHNIARRMGNLKNKQSDAKKLEPFIDTSDETKLKYPHVPHIPYNDEFVEGYKKHKSDEMLKDDVIIDVNDMEFEELLQPDIVNEYADDAENGLRYLKVKKTRIPGMADYEANALLRKIGYAGSELLNYDVESDLNGVYDSSIATSIQHNINKLAEQLLSVYPNENDEQLVDVVLHAPYMNVNPAYRSELRSNPELLRMTHDYIKNILTTNGWDNVAENIPDDVDKVKNIDDMMLQMMDAFNTQHPELKELVEETIRNTLSDSGYNENSIGNQVMTLDALRQYMHLNDEELHQLANSQLLDLLTLQYDIEQVTYDKIRSGDINAIKVLKETAEQYKREHNLDDESLSRLAYITNSNNKADSNIVKTINAVINGTQYTKEHEFNLIKSLFNFDNSMKIWKSVLNNVLYICYNVAHGPLFMNLAKHFVNMNPNTLIASMFISESVRDIVNHLMDKYLINNDNKQFFDGWTGALKRLFGISWRSGLIKSIASTDISKNIISNIGDKIGNAGGRWLLKHASSMLTFANKYLKFDKLVNGITWLKNYITNFFMNDSDKRQLYSAVMIPDSNEGPTVVPSIIRNDVLRGDIQVNTLQQLNHPLKILDIMSTGAYPALHIYYRGVEFMARMLNRLFSRSPNYQEIHDKAINNYRDKIIALHDKMINEDVNNNVNNDNKQESITDVIKDAAKDVITTGKNKVKKRIKMLEKDVMNAAKDVIKDAVKDVITTGKNKVKKRIKMLEKDIIPDVMNAARDAAKDVITTGKGAIKRRIKMLEKDINK